MKKLVLIVVALIAMSNLYSQTNKGLRFKTGFDRLGVFVDQSINMEIKNHHQVDFGLRYYLLDYIFERNIVGMSFGYNYHIKTENEKWFFGPGINAAFFRENKTSSTVYVSNILIQNKLVYCLNERWGLMFSTGVGTVINKVESAVLGESLVYPIFNYELGLGIRFFWSIDKDV